MLSMHKELTKYFLRALFFMSLFPIMFYLNGVKQEAVFCQCTTYIQKLFQLPNDYPKAAKFSSYLSENEFSRVSAPQIGAVAIMQENFGQAVPADGHVSVITYVKDLGLSWEITTKGGNQNMIYGTQMVEDGCTDVNIYTWKSYPKSWGINYIDYWMPPSQAVSNNNPTAPATWWQSAWQNFQNTWNGIWEQIAEDFNVHAQEPTTTSEELSTVTNSPTFTPKNTTKPGSWMQTGSMSIARSQFGMVVLDDGRVLAVGGCNTDPCSPLPSSEIYDPSTGLWSPTGNLNVQRWQFNQIVKLNDGRILITGGTGVGPYDDLASTEIYDPATGQWTFTGNLNIARRGFFSIVLADGRVLVAGGGHGLPDGNRFLASSEIYDPATGLWTYTGNLNIARTDMPTVLLNDGRVMGVGGEGPWYVQNVHTEIYSPSIGSWTLGGDIPVVPQKMIKMLNGKVIATGGWNGTAALNNAYVFDPTTGNWAQTMPMFSPRASLMMANLPDRRVLVFGGYDGTNYLAASEIYDPITGNRTPDATLLSARAQAVSVELKDGRILVCGGVANGQSLSSCEIYTPA